MKKIIWLFISSFFVLNLFSSTGQPTKPITLKMPSEKLSLTTTLAACLKPRSPHIFNRADLANPPTFQEHAEWKVNSECEMAESAFLKKYNIKPDDFNERCTEASWFNACYFAGKVAVSSADRRIPEEMLTLVKQCAQEMRYFYRISVKPEAAHEKSGAMATGYDASEVKLFLNLAKTAHLPIDQQKFNILHEMMHVQKRHSLRQNALIALSSDENSEHDDAMANLKRCQEKQADICALLLNRPLIGAAKDLFCTILCRVHPDLFEKTDQSIHIMRCQRNKDLDGTISYNIDAQVGQESKKFKVPYVIATGNVHPEFLDRIAYLDDLQRDWDKHDQCNQVASSSQTGQSS